MINHPMFALLHLEAVNKVLKGSPFEPIKMPEALGGQDCDKHE